MLSRMNSGIPRNVDRQFTNRFRIYSQVHFTENNFEENRNLKIRNGGLIWKMMLFIRDFFVWLGLIPRNSKCLRFFSGFTKKLNNLWKSSVFIFSPENPPQKAPFPGKIKDYATYSVVLQVLKLP